MPHHNPAAAGQASTSATGGPAQSLRCLQPPALCCWSHVGAPCVPQPAGTLAQAAAAAACTPALQQQGMLLPLLPLVVVVRASQAAVGCLQCHCLVVPGQQQQQEPQQGPKTGWLTALQG